MVTQTPAVELRYDAVVTPNFKHSCAEAAEVQKREDSETGKRCPPSAREDATSW